MGAATRIAAARAARTGGPTRIASYFDPSRQASMACGGDSPDEGNVIGGANVGGPLLPDVSGGRGKEHGADSSPAADGLAACSGNLGGYMSSRTLWSDGPGFRRPEFGPPIATPPGRRMMDRWSACGWTAAWNRHGSHRTGGAAPRNSARRASTRLAPAAGPRSDARVDRRLYKAACVARHARAYAGRSTSTSKRGRHERGVLPLLRRAAARDMLGSACRRFPII